MPLFRTSSPRNRSCEHTSLSGLHTLSVRSGTSRSEVSSALSPIAPTHSAGLRSVLFLYTILQDSGSLCPDGFGEGHPQLRHRTNPLRASVSVFYEASFSLVLSLRHRLGAGFFIFRKLFFAFEHHLFPG